MTTNYKNSIVAEGYEVMMDCKTKANPPVIDHSWFYDERMIKTDSFKGIVIYYKHFLLLTIKQSNDFYLFQSEILYLF
jgi:predicted ATP-binding protein involved in virulence